MKRIVLLDADDGRIESYAAMTRTNKEAYCSRHGYAYHHYHISHAPSPAWGLVDAMLSLVSFVSFDWMLFTGADACIVDPSFKIESLVNTTAGNPAADLLITRDANGLNTNGFVLRNSPWSHDFLKAVHAYYGQTFAITGPDGTVHHWEEQGAFIRVLERPGMLDHVAWLPQEIMNGYDPAIYGYAYKQPQFIAHYPALSEADRVRYIREAIRDAELRTIRTTSQESVADRSA